MGNQLKGQDLHRAGYVDTGKYLKVRSNTHPLFGNIDILRLAQKPKSLNTQNKLILNSDHQQLFMSISTELPKLGLQQIMKSILLLQKNIQLSEKNLNTYNFLKFIEMGQQDQGKSGQKGIIVEYYDRSLLDIVQQRSLTDLHFTEPELWYIIETLITGSQKLLDIPYLDYILKQVPFKFINVMVTDEGNIKISSIVIFLSNPGEINAENPQNSLRAGFYKELLAEAKKDHIRFEKKDQHSLIFCGADERQKSMSQSNQYDPLIIQTSKKSVFDIGELVLGLANLSQSVSQDLDTALETIPAQYSPDLVNLIIKMLDSRENRPTLAEVNQTLIEIKNFQQFATSIGIQGDIFKQISQISSQPNLQQSILESSDKIKPRKPSQTKEESLIYRPASGSEKKDEKITPSNKADIQPFSPYYQVYEQEVNKHNQQIVANIQASKIQDRRSVQSQSIPYIADSYQVNQQMMPQTQSLSGNYNFQFKTQIPQKVQQIQQPFQEIAQNSRQTTTFYSTNRTLDQRVEQALYNSRQALQRVGVQGGITQRSPERRSPEGRFQDLQQIYGVQQESLLDEEFEAKFWRVIKEAKQQVLQIEDTYQYSNNQGKYF